MLPFNNKEHYTVVISIIHLTVAFIIHFRGETRLPKYAEQTLGGSSYDNSLMSEVVNTRGFCFSLADYWLLEPPQLSSMTCLVCCAPRVFLCRPWTSICQRQSLSVLGKPDRISYCDNKCGLLHYHPHSLCRLVSYSTSLTYRLRYS